MKRTQEYLAELAKNDVQDNSITITKITEKNRAINKVRYELLEEKLKESGQPQLVPPIKM
jgi:hypothetical protein